LLVSVLTYAVLNTIGGDGQIVRRAFAQHQAEGIDRETAEDVLAAHEPANALADGAYGLIRDGAAAAIFDMRQVVDGDEQKSA